MKLVPLVFITGALGLFACGPDRSPTEPSNDPSIGGPDMAAAAAGTSRIAFLVDVAEGEDDQFTDVYTIVADGCCRRRVAGRFYDGGVTWAPGGATAKIAAVAEQDIYVINPDGSGSTNITGTQNEGETQPDWSPDGTRIVYLGDPAGIYIMNADGSGKRRLTNSTAFERAPKWSPDGRRILFLRDNTVRVMNVDGSNNRTLAHGDQDAVWSPDGRQIAFRRDHEIYVMNSDGTGQRNASNHPAADGSPVWSPNSARIAFSTSRKGTQELYVMGRYGGSKTRLTYTTPGAGAEPRGWSPGGARILYESGGDIWVVNADGTNNHRVTRGREAAWSR